MRAYASIQVGWGTYRCMLNVNYEQVVNA